MLWNWDNYVKYLLKLGHLQQAKSSDCITTLKMRISVSGPVFSYKLRYIVGFWLVEMAISTNQKPTIYRNLYENTGPELGDINRIALNTVYNG